MSARPAVASWLVLPVAAVVLLAGCGASAGSAAPPAPSAPAVATPATSAGDPAEPSVAATQGDGSGAVPSAGGGPIGGDLGDRSKGSVQAQITGGLTSSVDLPFAPALARLLLDGPKTAYLPFTDPVSGTLFLTIADSGLLVQYAGPNQVALTNGATPCELHLDGLDGSGAKGTFSCKGMLLVKDGAMGSADMTGTFEGRQ